jgi:hypothetical protein
MSMNAQKLNQFLFFPLISALLIALPSVAGPHSAAGPKLEEPRAPLETSCSCMLGPIVPANTPMGIDKSAKMQKQWSDWHERAEKLFNERFRIASRQFRSIGRPLSCQISFQVEPNAHVSDTHIVTPSVFALFNVCLMQMVDALDLNEKLAFPAHTSIRAVTMTATFKWK